MSNILTITTDQVSVSYIINGISTGVPRIAYEANSTTLRLVDTITGKTNDYTTVDNFLDFDINGVNPTDINDAVKQVNGVVNFTSGVGKISTGWAQYGDSEHTSSNTLSIASGSSAVITIDGLVNTVTSQLPEGVTDFYDTSTNKIIPVNNGDGYMMSISFQGITNNNNGDATIYIDIGGSFTRLFPKSFQFNRGTGVAHEYYFVFTYYTLGTFLANGGTINIESGTGTTQIYDVLLQIHKTHNAI